MKRLSSFSVILIMVLLMVIGGFMLPLLNIQYSPQTKNQNISVYFGYYGASARVVEQEVTSKIEGVLSTLDGVIGTSAISRKGSGSVTIQFKKGTKIDIARFEIATLIRQIYSKLPEGTSYPTLNTSTSGGSEQHIMTYTINADLPPDRIVKYAEEIITTPLSRIKGVESVRTSGATPFQWVITFDPDALRAAKLTVNDLSAAFSAYFADNIVGSAMIDEELMTVRLKSNSGAGELESIPIKNVEGRMFFMRNFAKITYEEMLPSSYFRINGLNTINLSIFATEGINTVKVADEVKKVMANLESSFPPNYTTNLTYDQSETISKEISKIFLRSILSLLILLAFVFAVSRSVRYLFVIFLTIAVNLLMSVIFYYIFQIDIEFYSMAGITISLGIIIDAAIVMVDHYTYYNDRKVFTSILGAMLTTIGALAIIFFLPDNQKANLIDFVWVIIINLSLSLLIAFLFVPALLEKMPLRNRGVAATTIRARRRLVWFSNTYERVIIWSRRHRWIFIVVLILGFGLPINLLPKEVRHKQAPDTEKRLTEEERKQGGLVGFYNKTIGGAWYQEHKKPLEIALGGTFRLFSSGLNSSSYYRQPEPQKVLTARAFMPEGCTVQQLNDILRAMENWLSQFPEIDMYRTNINSAAQGYISVTFKREFEKSSFPYTLKQQMWSKATGYGGATWSIYGIDDRSLSNNIYGGYKSYSIKLYGYNYDMLYRYAETLIDSLSSNKRVSLPEITNGSGYDGGLSRNEFFIRYDRAKIARSDLNVARYYGFLGEQLYDRKIGSVFNGDDMTTVSLVSAKKDAFDLWHITNDMIDIDSVKTRLADVGTIEKRRTGNDIRRNNQQYELNVAFDFIGPYELANRLVDRTIKRWNEEILPIGYRMESTRGWWGWDEKKQQTALIFIVIALIYMISSIIFESLRKPLTVVLMIPVGFIGLFLTFSLFDIKFDQGGFAAMVMLCGIVVNAAIYIISEYNTIRARSRMSDIQVYVKAYNRKIVPTLLTILSTVLGLIPFLIDGKEDVFWYAFATGVMGGMTFSVIALLFFMPVFMSFKGGRILLEK